MVCAGGIRQIGDIGGMRDWWLAIVVCLVLVVSVSLGPVVCERVSTQRATDVPESRVAQATQEFSVTQTALSARVYRTEIAVQDGGGGWESASVQCRAMESWRRQ